MVKLIVSDIDGTLLPYGQTALSPTLFPVIRALKERGVIFCPASGRQYHSLRGLFAPVQNELAYLCENGAILYGAGREDIAPVLGKTAMPREESLALAEDILQLPGCQLLVSGANASYVCRCPQSYLSLLRDEKGNRVRIVEHPRQVGEDILKVSAYCPGGTEEPAKALGPRWGSVMLRHWMSSHLARLVRRISSMRSSTDCCLASSFRSRSRMAHNTRREWVTMGREVGLDRVSTP